MKKILFGITNLSVGGAEKTLVDIVNKINDTFDIDIFTIYANGEFEKNLNKNIKIKSLYPMSYDYYSRIKKLLISLRIILFKKHIYRKYIFDNYDKEIAFLEGPVTTLFSVRNNNTKKIAWIHNDISLVFGNNFKSKIKKIHNKSIYKKYEKLVFVSNHNLNKFNEFYNINVEKEVVHNYLNTENIINLSKEFNVDIFDNNSINFVSACRLVEQKAIDRLIDVHKKLIDNGFNHKFFIVGDGPLKNKLEEKINSLDIPNTFILLGQKENPYPYILNADYFCLLSYYEGLPMALLEAKALNKYILITNTASAEALENYENKKIFENNEDAIFNGLKDIITNHKNINTNNENTFDENNEIIKKLINILGE